MEQNRFFPEIKGRFGFGCMRLPQKDGQTDFETTAQMVDRFLEAGFNYFDTAAPYLGGQSEEAIRRCIAERYGRGDFVLTDKLSRFFFDSEEEIRPLFARQLAACGVEYFDFYLMHAQTAPTYEKYRRCRAYETALEFKKEGRIRHFGISFHDRAEVLERILTDWPEIEAVQIQFNYLDYADPTIDSRRVYEVCERYGKPVIVMEPVKGGALVQLPGQAQAALDALGGSCGSAGYALRFAAGFPQVAMVLSGMSAPGQMEENLAVMARPAPLEKQELAALEEVRRAIRALDMIGCTACRYCTDGCPMRIRIPDLFAVYNAKRLFQNRNQTFYYNDVFTGSSGGKASDCIACGQCERACPQGLPIRQLLRQVAEEFEG